MRSPKKKPFSKSRKRSKFKTTNWPQYNNSLRNRGRIDFMISKNLSDGWYEDNIGTKKRGGQKRYSDKAILICLQIRYLFALKLRQSQGFIDWIAVFKAICKGLNNSCRKTPVFRTCHYEFILYDLNKFCRI
jgi:hypothetical protein